MFLSRAQAKLVYACEWNPHAVEALQHNLEANSVADRCIILEGDNRITAPKVVCVCVCVYLTIYSPSKEKIDLPNQLAISLLFSYQRNENQSQA